MNAILRQLAIGLLRGYQLLLSPLFTLAGARCRHEPTCSNFAIEAFRLHPPFKAMMLTIGRLSRCRPGGTSGYDPVPQPQED